MNAHAFPHSATTGFPPLPRLVLLAAVCGALSGCSDSKLQPQALDQIVIRGSNTVGEELAPALIEGFKKQDPRTDFDLEFKGTPYGIGALLVGRAHIAAASRPMTTNELKLAAERDITPEGATIGSYAVAVVVHAGNPVRQLTAAQVQGIFTGAIANWKEVGGADQPVTIHIRDQISGTHLGFQEVAMNHEPYALSARPHPSYEEILQAVAAEAGGIGYASLQLAGQPGIKALEVNGTAPTIEAVHQDAYPYARTLRLYMDKERATFATRAFVKYALSVEGQKVLSDAGYVPNP